MSCTHSSSVQRWSTATGSDASTGSAEEAAAAWLDEDARRFATAAATAFSASSFVEKYPIHFNLPPDAERGKRALYLFISAQKVV